MDVEVGIKNARFRAGLEECRNHARKFSGDLRQMFASSLGSIGTALSLGGLTAAFGKILRQTHEIKHAADQFGISAQSMQRVANGMAYGNIERVAPLLNKLVISQERAREGNKKLAASFEVLGVSQQELDSLSPDELLYRIADGTKNASDRGAAYNAVVSIMGRTAGDFFHKLEKGSEVLKQNGDNMGVYSDKAVASFDKLYKKINSLKGHTLPLLAEIGSFFASVASYGAKGWKMAWESAKAGGDFTKEAFGFGSGRKGSADRYFARMGSIGDYSKKALADDFGDGKGPDDHGRHPTGKRAVGFSGDGGDPGAGADGESGAARIATLQEKKARMEEEAREKSLTAERLITGLKERQVRLTQEGAEARKGGDEEEALKKEIDAAEAGKKASEERARVNREVAATAERIAAIEREGRLSEMKPQERIHALEKERAALLRAANFDQVTGDMPGAAKKRLEAAERGREIEKENKNVLTEAQRSADDGLRKKAEHDEKAAQDEDQIKHAEKEARERQIARLPADQQRALRMAEKTGIDAESVGVKEQMMAETDPDKKRGLRVRLAELSLSSEEKADQIASLEPRKEGKRVSVSADSLQRVGGGGGIGPALDPMLRRADRQIDLLQKLVEQGGGKGGRTSVVSEGY